jgi:putative transposase
VANAYAERFVRTARTECLDWVLIWNRRHLERVLSAYVGYYNDAWPHSGTQLQAPIPGPAPAGPAGPVQPVDLLGGLVHEYRRAA